MSWAQDRKSWLSSSQTSTPCASWLSPGAPSKKYRVQPLPLIIPSSVALWYEGLEEVLSGWHWQGHPGLCIAPAAWLPKASGASRHMYWVAHIRRGSMWVQLQFLKLHQKDSRYLLDTSFNLLSLQLLLNHHFLGLCLTGKIKSVIRSDL